MKIVFITRTTAESEKDFDKPTLIRLIQEVSNSKIKLIYVIAKFNTKSCKIGGVPVVVIQEDNPTSPIAINTAVQKIKADNITPNAFLIASQEVNLTKDRIIRLSVELKQNKDLLVIGYKFGIRSKELDEELSKFYNNPKLIAYQVPWNTCAMWNYDLFEQYVSKFDEITAKNPFGYIGVTIDGEGHTTEHRGMEDGLAIAQAVTSSNGKIRYKLIEDELLEWKINPKKIIPHRQKLARKDAVMRNFMALRNYSVSDLIEAKYSE